MSQKVKISGVRVHGAVFLGRVEGVESWSSNPDIALRWLANGWRTRFNQHRSKRTRWVTGFEDQVGAVDGRVQIPIGSSVTSVSDSEARAAYSFMSALPAMVLQSPDKAESTSWFAAVKRRKANVLAGRPAGAMPRFKNRNKTDLAFTCFFNKGGNARFVKTGKKSGIVTITGKNPSGKYGPETKLNFRIVIRVRLSQPIRDYTSVLVNVTSSTLVFVNAPLPVRVAPTGAVVGLDFGVSRTIATSDGVFFDQPALTVLEAKRRAAQKRMAKSRVVALAQKRNFWESNRYQGQKKKAATASAKIARVRADWQHKTATLLVRDYDVIGLENLNLRNMTQRARGAGAAQKRGLNRALNTSALGNLRQLIDYKAELTGAVVVPVNPAYTSQQCNLCDHTGRENRKSQAVFLCRKCGHTANADVNAASNIRDKALVTIGLTEKVRQARTLRLTGSPLKTDHPLLGTDTTSAAQALNRKPLTAA